MRIFLDANILFAAALPKSRTGAFFRKFKRCAVLLTSAYAVEETRRNLAGKRPDALPNLELLLKHIEVNSIAFTSFGVGLARKDAPILGGAIASNATHLLTGDRKDFGALWGKTIRGVKIVSPQMLTDELVKGGLLKKN